MTQERWRAVDDYISGLLAPPEQALQGAIAGQAWRPDCPPIQVTAPQGKLLNLLARTVGAETILEFGTLGGYSTIWLARALGAGGRLISLEADPAYAEVARRVSRVLAWRGCVEQRIGPALETLPQTGGRGSGAV